MKKIFYRIFQFVMKIAMYVLPWRKPEMILGENAVEKIPNILKKHNLSVALIVTDKGIEQHGLHLSLLEQLDKSGIKYHIYDNTVPNPTIDNIEEALDMYKTHKCQCLISIGGGSPIDCAKAIGARVVSPHKSISKMRGLLKVSKKLPFHIAIPTTSGTGSETTLASVVTDSKTHEKYAINDTHLIPDCAVLDPTLTISLPQSLTATTGLDALTHAVEAYIGNCNTKETKKNAEMAVALIFDNLPTAVNFPDNVKARENMQIAAYMAGVAFTRAYVGNVHSIAHTLGGQYSVPHGLANAVILPKVLRYYGKSIYKRINRLCEINNLFPSFQTPKTKTEAFINYIEKMNHDFSIPQTIKELKVADIPTLIARAKRESNPLYPVPIIFDNKDFETIYTSLLTK